jgi:hypothetical protein
MSTTKPSAPKGAKTAAKKSATKKSESKQAASTPKASGKTKSTQHAKRTTRKSEGAVAKAGAVIDTMGAGAVVGAVMAAALAIDQNQVKALNGGGKKPPTTAGVLGDLAPDAAMGAVVGAAQTVLPVEEKPKQQSPKKTKA